MWELCREFLVLSISIHFLWMDTVDLTSQQPQWLFSVHWYEVAVMFYASGRSGDRVVLACFIYYPSVLLEELKKNMETG